MARVTKIKTSPATLLPPGEGLRRLMAPMTVKSQRQAAEREAVSAKGDTAVAAAKTKVAKLRLVEKHLKENGR